jgi:SAM-dependent methyltransferase
MGTVFDRVAAEYDRSRPRYPDGVFDQLGDLDGRLVLEGGAGTGIATRALVARGARVVAVDVGADLLRLAAGIAGASGVRADAAALPIADASVELVCFAQSWHWIAQPAGTAEVARVLVDGGRWVAWWSQPHADGAPWFDGTWDLLEATFPGVVRDDRTRDWGATLADLRLDRPVCETVPWTRRIAPSDWVAELSTVSYVADADADVRDRLLAAIDALLRRETAGQRLEIPYRTAVWSARRRSRSDA